jgi:protein-disulfide isomerase
MPTKLSALAAATLMLAAGYVSGPVPAAAEDGFSSAQKQELHGIIRDYLVNNPEILNEMVEKLQMAERQRQANEARDAVASNSDELFNNPDDAVVGNPDGNVTVVEFFDYNCGYCKRSVADVLRLTEEDKNVRVVMKEFPILSEGSVIAARAAIASREQGKYWDFHLALMAAQGGVDSEEKVMQVARNVGLDIDKLKADMTANAGKIDTIINANRELAQKLGINGTPAFVIDDILVPGAIPFEQLAQGVNAVREKGGCQFC